MLLENRPLFHIHIPKTAGLTLRAIFAEILGVEQVFKLGLDATGVYNKIEDFVARDWPDPNEKQPPKVYIGHFSFGAHSRIFPSPFISICLRHPVERVLSLYGYECRYHRQSLDIDHFLDTNPESSNGMVRRICGYDELDGGYYDFINQCPVDRDPYDLDESDLEKALSTLESSVDYLLIQERMVESLVGFRHALHMPPLVSMHHQFLNNAEKPTTRNDYPPEIVEKILRLNQLDIQLYERGLELFNRQIESQKLSMMEVEATKRLSEALFIRGHNELSGEEVANQLSATLSGLLSQEKPGLVLNILTLLRERLPNNPSISEAYARQVKNSTSNSRVFFK